MKQIFSFFVIFISLPALFAWGQNRPGRELLIRKSTGTIKLDARLEEDAWKQAETATDFFLNYPADTIPPSFQSEVKTTFDDEFLYFGIVCFDNDQPDIVQSLRRDVDWEGNDNIGVYIDPFNDFTNGFFFTVTPMGVQSEGIISGGGASGDSFNDNWDNKWYSKVSRMADRWVAEIAIPFKTLRYNLSDWNITFLRNDVKRNQISSWIATPIQYIPASFAYAGKLKWEQLPPLHKSNISIIPYLSAGASRDLENNEPSEATFNAGFDAKVALTPSLNLDLTFNPDFSQVEVDRQVINLTRFEFGFPERRQFFLENNDLFSGPGFPDSQPFFSRRIGLIADSSGQVEKVPILYGARVSGKIGKDWRIGAMNLHTMEKKSAGLPQQNYSVAVVQRQVFARSNIGFVFVNKHSLGVSEYDPDRYYHESLIHEEFNGTDTVRSVNSFNRAYGVDFNLNSKDNKWQGDIFYHRSADGFSQDKNYSFGAFVGYFTRKINLLVAQQGIGENFRAETGFVPGLEVYPGFYAGGGQAEYKIYPQSRRVNVMGPELEVEYLLTPDGALRDRAIRLEYGINFLNTSRLEFGAFRVFQKLTQDFTPVDSEGSQVFVAGESFQWTQYGIEYRSNTRKVFNFELEANYGGFYNGTNLNLQGEMNYRYQPFGSISVRVDYNDINLPDAFGATKFLLVGPRLDLTFTDKIFLTTFVQYNDRSENVNLNARLQWRFKPASDLYLVYTENYLPGNLASKNRALVLKLTYWLNL